MAPTGKLQQSILIILSYYPFSPRLGLGLGIVKGGIGVTLPSNKQPTQRRNHLRKQDRHNKVKRERERGSGICYNMFHYITVLFEGKGFYLCGSEVVPKRVQKANVRSTAAGRMGHNMPPMSLTSLDLTCMSLNLMSHPLYKYDQSRHDLTV